MPPKAEFSYGGVAALASANSDGVVDARHEDLAVADAAGMGRAADCLDRLLDHLILDDELDLHLGQEVDHVLGAAIQLGMALLPAETLHLGHGQAGDPDLRERFAHLVELERLHDRFDLLHGFPPPGCGHCIVATWKAFGSSTPSPLSIRRNGTRSPGRSRSRATSSFPRSSIPAAPAPRAAGCRNSCCCAARASWWARCRSSPRRIRTANTCSTGP